MELKDSPNAASTEPAVPAPRPHAWQLHLEERMSGKSVLNVFSGNCALGILAAQSGARFVVNVDRDELAIAGAKEFCRRAALPIRPRFVVSDAFAAMRQFAGIGQSQRVRGKLMPAFPKLEARQFDLVIIDPPLHSKSLFGVVDLLADYVSVFKPALLCTTVGGTLVCTNRVVNLDRNEWVKQLERAATKAGRPITSVEWPSATSATEPCVVVMHLA